MKKSSILFLVVLILIAVIGTAVTIELNIYVSRKEAAKQARERWKAPGRPPAGPPSPLPRPATPQEKERVIAIVREFMGQPDLPLKFRREEIEYIGSTETIELATTNPWIATEFGYESFTVELTHNYVMSANFGRAVEKANGPVLIPPAQAEAVAKEFVEKHFPNFPKMKMVLKKSRLDTPTHGPKSYSFEWQSKDTHSFVAINISPNTGEIMSYSARYDNRKIDSRPKIKRAKALEIARRELSNLWAAPETYKVEEAYLYVSYVYYTPMLLWHIVFRGPPAEKRPTAGENIITVEVDAHTGDSWIMPRL